ncbi:ROK family glucokinase [Bacillus sp. 03113]|uniref:ROK family glucokinase n=1 Tax=Bacillus sp. 03113 TaxID=2578211 RepID=UPI001143AC75|nr:ROK family glucokinase [Bacillus sp. 03113]
MAEKYIIGVDLGGTTIKLAFLNEDGDILTKWEIPTDNSFEGVNITLDVAKAINDKLLELKISKDDVIGLGMGAPGPVDLETGIIFNTVNLGWKDHYPLKEKLQEATGFSVVVENDANCAALGEMWKGAGTGSKNIVCVTLGTGVGGGVIANGDIVGGVRGAAGEIGHMTAVTEGGAQCNCGKTGCLETVASATGIVRLALEQLGKSTVQNGTLAEEAYQADGVITAKMVFDAARRGDIDANIVVQKVGFYLGLALSHIANTLNPDKIVIGGGVSKAGDILLSLVKENFHKYSFKSVAESTQISIATLGNDAGVIGAAWLAKNK